LVEVHPKGVNLNLLNGFSLTGDHLRDTGADAAMAVGFGEAQIFKLRIL